MIIMPPNATGGPAVDRTKRIVLIGTTGVGKSTIGNAMLGLDTDCDSEQGFIMSSSVKSCTSHASKIDGFWMGDPTKPVRVIDTPGHGDSQGRDTQLRQSIVDFMKEERFVHAFVWLKNSQAPKFDKQDKEFFRIFAEMFGAGFFDNLVVILTRYSFSKSSERARMKSKTSLEEMIGGLRLKVFPQDTEKEVPMYAIDALHDPENPREAAKYNKYMAKFWESIQKFGEQPVENIKMVKDDLATLKDEVEGLTAELDKQETQHTERLRNMEEVHAAMKSAHELEKQRLAASLADFENQLQKHQLEAAENEKENLMRLEELQQAALRQQTEKQELEAKWRKENEEIQKMIAEEKQAADQRREEYEQQMQRYAQEMAILNQKLADAMKPRRNWLLRALSYAGPIGDLLIAVGAPVPGVVMKVCSRVFCDE